MNKQRRSELNSVSKKLETVKARVESISVTMSADDINNIFEELDGLRCRIESIRDDEQCAFDGLPESFQYSEKGATMEEYISELNDVEFNLSDAISNIEEIVDNINDEEYSDAMLIDKKGAISSINTALAGISNCV